MSGGVIAAASGMRAQMDALDLLANNLSNLNTAGFKEQKSFFSVLNESMELSKSDAQDASAADRLVVARGALKMTDGTPLATQRDLDLAISGDGFLTVLAPQGTRYTRNGNLMINKKSQLATADGYPVLGENGPILVRAGKLNITEQGDVFLDGVRLDRLKIRTFDTPSLMVSEGTSLFAPPNDQASPKVSNAVVRQGFLEQSNVNPVGAVVEMVGIMRRFEALQKTVGLMLNDLDAKSIEKLPR